MLLTTCNLAALAIQSLAVNAAKVESDVLYCASLADPCEMESLTVRAHIGHCCVSVGLLAMLHLRCTRDVLNLDISMLPWHSMAAVRCQVLLGPRSVVSIGASDPSSPKDLSLPPQEPDRTHALSFYVTCVLMSSHSCAVVLWVRAVYSDCFLLLPAAQI